MTRLRKILKWGGIAVLVLLVVACIAPYLVPIESYDPAAIEAPFDNSVFTDIDGVRMHYRVWDAPQDPPAGHACLIHGFSGSTFSYRHNIDAFRRLGYRVVAVDVPPFGYSDRRTDVVASAANQGDLTWQLLGQLAEADTAWVLVGHSMGGGVIAEMAAAAPDRVDSLIFVDGSVGGGRPEGASPSLTARLRSAALACPPVVRWVEVVAKHRLFQPANIEELLTSAYGEPPDAEAVQGYLDALRVPGTARAILARMSGRGGDRRADPATIEAPSLLIWGGADTWVPLSRGERLHEQLPNSELHVIEGAGHNPMETHPSEFDDLVMAFLNGRLNAGAGTGAEAPAERE